MSIQSCRKRERLQAWALMRRWGCALWGGVLLGVVATANEASATDGPSNPVISVSPTHIVWTSNEWVTVAVSNLAAGAEVQLELYLDVQENGVVDASDLLLASCRVQDGRTNALGSSVIVDDGDGTVNGVVVGRIAYFGVEGILHVVGHYLWRARPVEGGTPVAVPFSVTQPTSAVWITGSVIDYVTSNPVPAAVVSMECFDENLSTPVVWTGTNGTFTVYLPDGVSTADVSVIYANGLGYFSPSVDESEENHIASYEFTGNLEGGENPLPLALRVVPKIADDIFEVSGHLYDDQTNALPGVAVQIEWNDGEDGATAVTDSNGFYRACMPGESNAQVFVDSGPLMYLGLLTVSANLVVTNDVTGVDLYCPRATWLASGSVLAAEDEEPVVGAVIELDGDGFGGMGVTLEDGSFQIGAIAYTNYSVSEDNLDMLGFMDGAPFEGVSITNNACTNLDFRPQRVYPLSGVVYDSNTNRTTGGYAGTFRYPSGRKFWEWEANTRINRIGEYRLLVPVGEWAVVVADVPGCVGVVYANYLYPDWDNNHIADPVTNRVGGTDGIDFYLTPLARIEGQVRDGEGDPMRGVVVRAEELDGSNWQMSGEGVTDENGFYSLGVPPGSNYGVKVKIPENMGLFWLAQYFDHVHDRSDARPVSASGDAPTTNINFDLEQGGIISGWIYEDDGETPIEGCGVRAETLDGSVGSDGRTDAAGYFEIIVPAGTYAVEARPDWDELPYGRQYFSNVVSGAEAYPLSVDQFGVVSNIIFQLGQRTISGHVYRGGDMTPLAHCHVFACDYDSNNWIAGTDTDDTGGYTLYVSPGRYRVRALPSQNGLLYESRLYSNTFSYGEATPVVVAGSGNAEGVDFTLNAAGTISGYVHALEGGSPLGNCQVVAEAEDSGEWMGWDDTGADGSYTLVVPEGFYRVYARPSNRGMPYVDTYYLNTPQREEAALVWVGGTGNTPDIDLNLMAPSCFQGRVTDKTTGLPIPGMTVQAIRIPNTNDFWNNWSWYDAQPTDSNGLFSVSVPSGDHYVIYINSGSSFYRGVCWSNQLSFMEAPLLAIGAAVTVSNIDFILEAGGKITGHIYREDGGAPLEECNVYAEEYGSGQWAAGARSDSSGFYSMTVAAGTSYRIGVMPSNTGLPYLDEWFNDAIEPTSAVAVPATLSNETGGIDFSLMVSDLSSSEWKTHYFSMAELGDPDIGADDADPDHDGANNLEEYVADTDPRRSNSVLRVTGNVRVGGGLRIEWKGGRWARQYIQRRESLNAGDWTDVYTNDNLPTVATNFVLDVNTGHPALFYRIKVAR